MLVLSEILMRVAATYRKHNNNLKHNAQPTTDNQQQSGRQSASAVDGQEEKQTVGKSRQQIEMGICLFEHVYLLMGEGKRRLIFR